MATLTLEVFSRFQSATDANKLLYTPIADKLTYNHTRLYTVECEGDVEAARDYMRRVLVDPISQKVEEGGAPALSGELFCISYGIKKGALDLEKEAILTNYRGRSGMPFTITSRSSLPGTRSVLYAPRMNGNASRLPCVYATMMSTST